MTTRVSLCANCKPPKVALHPPPKFTRAKSSFTSLLSSPLLCLSVCLCPNRSKARLHPTHTTSLHPNIQVKWKEREEEKSKKEAATCLCDGCYFQLSSLPSQREPFHVKHLTCSIVTTAFLLFSLSLFLSPSVLCNLRSSCSVVVQVERKKNQVRGKNRLSRRQVTSLNRERETNWQRTRSLLPVLPSSLFIFILFRLLLQHLHSTTIAFNTRSQIATNKK